MRCPECEFDNREGAKFCKECGAKLELACPKCDSLITPDSKFCDECGYDLSTPAIAPPVHYTEPQSYTPKFLADKILTTRGRSINPQGCKPSLGQKDEIRLFKCRTDPKHSYK